MNIIVTTTINPPTEALRKFSEINGWTLVVVGDRKTPQGWSLPGAIYLSPEEQESRFPSLSSRIGWNCIQRRNIGFLVALEMGADLVATVDDDNVPLDDVDFNESILLGKKIEVVNFFDSNTTTVFDPISQTNYPHLWHRGFPIQSLSDRKYFRVAQDVDEFDVQAAFWNGDPDIDAICRMEHSPDCDFDDQCFPMASRLVAPFNSQNTILTRPALKDYFMFPGVGRMDDIWASYFLQAAGRRVVFSKASVRQERNPHDLTKDFEGEIIGYLSNHKLLESLRTDPESISAFLPEQSYAAFCEYREVATSL